MGLRDIFGRKPDPTTISVEEWNKLQRQAGATDARVEGLELKWLTFKDEMMRLVQRLEKRDQRARLRAQETIEPEEATTPRDEITERVMARRNRGAIRKR